MEKVSCMEIVRRKEIFGVAMARDSSIDRLPGECKSSQNFEN